MLWMHPLKDDGAEEFIRQAEAGTLKILSVHAAKTSAWATVANAEPGGDVQPFLLVMGFWGGKAWRIDLVIRDAKRTASLLEHFRKTKPDAVPIPPKQSKLDRAKGPAAGEAGKEDGDSYRGLYERYKAQILAAAKADNKDEVARLTDEFNELIAGRLLYLRVSRVDPVEFEIK
jgi:hypothetical protein